MRRRYWLMKSEPNVYPFAKLVEDGRTYWDGVRNYEARNNLRAMKEGDLAFFYHSNIGKEIVGIARIIKEAYPDPTAPGEDWSVVDIAPVMSMKKAVSLATIKQDDSLQTMALLRRSRLSVVPVSNEEFAHILDLGETELAEQGG